MDYKESDFTWVSSMRISGDKISKARTDAGMSQQELADRTGVKLRQVQRWEKDISKPSDESRAKLNGIFGTTWMK